MYPRQNKVYSTFVKCISKIAKHLEVDTPKHILIGSCGYGYDSESSDLDIVMSYREVFPTHRTGVVYDESLEATARWVQLVAGLSGATAVIKTHSVDSLNNRVRMEIDWTDSGESDSIGIDLSLAWDYYREVAEHNHRLAVIQKYPGIVQFIAVGRALHGRDFVNGYKTLATLVNMNIA